MNKQDLISYLDGGVEALRDLSYRPTHSDNQIRIGARLYTRKELEQLTAALETISWAVGDE